MSKDLRSFIDQIKREAPEHFLEVKKEIDCRHEIPAFLQHLEDNGKYPMVLFENVKNVKGRAPSLRVISNVSAARERLAIAIGSTVENVAMDYAHREQFNTKEPIIIDKKNAPVKEIILKGKEADLNELPIITHHEMDIGPYISAGDAWTKDPETGVVNCALIRMWAKEPQKLVVYFIDVRHTYHYYRKYAEKNEPMPMAVVIGHHAAFYMGAQTKIFGAELKAIGGMLGEPLELVPSETWGDKFYVPARAEIVIETEVLPNKVEIEAPFGEYTGYYGGQRLSYVAVVKSITRRKDAIFQDIFAGHRDHFLIDGPALEANVLAKLREVAPMVKNVYFPPSGTSRFHAYIQLKKTNDWEPKNIIATALAADYRIKHVWVVDEDVNIFNENEVLWAMATRFQGDEDLVMIRNMMGGVADPSISEGLRTAKVGFDCTQPTPPKSFERRVKISSEALDKVRKMGYVTEDEIKKLV